MPNSTLKIKKGIPMPLSYADSAGLTLERLTKMEIGDAIDLPPPPTDHLNKIYSAAKKAGIKVKVRINHGTRALRILGSVIPPGVTRIWRKEDEQP